MLSAGDSLAQALESCQAFCYNTKMSIENFKGMYPLDKIELRDILTKQSDREMSSTSRPPVVLLALNLAREGGNGLRESTKSFNPNMDSGLTPLDARRMPAGIREEVSKSFGAIGCGITICSIDDTIWNKTFSYELVASLYNKEMTGTPFVRLIVGEVKEEEILDDKHKAMISLASKDKTLTSFLEEKNLHLMPNALRSLLTQMGVLSVISNEIFPIFKPLAEFVID